MSVGMLSSQQVRVQVKSRYATDCDREFPVKEVRLDAFDFLVIAIRKIGSSSDETTKAMENGNPRSTPCRFSPVLTSPAERGTERELKRDS